MNLAIVGTGLVSPVGLTPLQHAAFPRAGLGLRPPSAFVGGDGDPVPVFHCPWLGAKLPVAERLAALGTSALTAATEVLAHAPVLATKEAALLVCLGAPRPGLAPDDRQHAVAAFKDATAAPLRHVFTGAASFFEALETAGRLLDAGEVRAVMLVAVDSFVSLDAVRAELEVAPAAWVREPPPLSEAGVALTLMKGTEGRGLGLSLGMIHHAGTRKGQGSDDDDELVDGVALAALLQEMPVFEEPVARVYGQDQVDRLRQTEWIGAAARNAARFHERVTTVSVEQWTGRVGGASGAAQLVYGLAAERHHAVLEAEGAAAPFVAWAISRDGTGGLCAATATGA
jgi:hypothetical protein